ncbi:MAG TPA: hypothetical protein VET85_11870 [Stellaceae bacterium]|nr:hypothetical protein [Stellaceae bacterium]
MDWFSIMQACGILFCIAGIVLVVRHQMLVARYIVAHRVGAAVARRVHEVRADGTMAVVVGGMIFTVIPQLADQLQRDCAPHAGFVPSVIGSVGIIFVGGIVAGILLARAQRRREAKAAV